MWWSLLPYNFYFLLKYPIHMKYKVPNILSINIRFSYKNLISQLPIWIENWKYSVFKWTKLFANLHVLSDIYTDIVYRSSSAIGLRGCNITKLWRRTFILGFWRYTTAWHHVITGNECNYRHPIGIWICWHSVIINQNIQ